MARNKGQAPGSYCGVWYSNADGDPTTIGDVRITYTPSIRTPSR